jgi:hypothetical protein
MGGRSGGAEGAVAHPEFLKKPNKPDSVQHPSIQTEHLATSEPARPPGHDSRDPRESRRDSPTLPYRDRRRSSLRLGPRCSLLWSACPADVGHPSLRALPPFPGLLRYASLAAWGWPPLAGQEEAALPAWARPPRHWPQVSTFRPSLALPASQQSRRLVSLRPLPPPLLSVFIIMWYC